MHPADMIFFWAQANPEKPAIILSNMTITYRELAIAILAVTERIKAQNFELDEPVAVAVDHPIRQIAICYALIRAGYTASLALPAMMPFLRQNGINNVIYAGSGQVLSGGRNVRFHDSWLRLDSPAPLAWNSADSSLAAKTQLIFFTSGTTGVPKKTFVPGDALLDWAKLLPIIGHANFDRVLVVPGLNSAMGYNHASLLFYAGKTVCFARSPADQLSVINAFAVEEILASPQQLVDLLAAIESGTPFHSQSIKEVRCGGGYLSPRIVKRIKARICRNVVSQYGATEAGLMAFANYDRLMNVPDAVGFVIPGMEVEIVDETNRPLDSGQSGRVRFRSSYYAKIFAANNPDAKEGEDVWWYPGDVGALTGNGILCIEGREDDVINCGGRKLSANTIDALVSKHPDVDDVGACGVRGSSGIEEIWIGVVPKPKSNLDVEKLKADLDQELQSNLTRVVTVDQIPRNDLGKIQRKQLRELLLKFDGAGPRA